MIDVVIKKNLKAE